MTSEHISVYTTFPDRDAARQAARALVGEGLAACANLAPIESIYWWQGRAEETSEVAVLLKTRKDLYERLAARIRQLHSYEVPAIVAYAIRDGLPAYLAWIDDATRPGRSGPPAESAD
jgi:periplasmic divalent cation tolerance protein